MTTSCGAQPAPCAFLLAGIMGVRPDEGKRDRALVVPQFENTKNETAFPNG